MKFVYSYNTRQNERRAGLVISARNRDAAYAELNKQGIRPFRLEPAPGFWNRISGLGWRWFIIAVLVLVVGILVAVALTQHKDIIEMGKDGDVREIVSEAISSRVRRQLIGDQGFIEKGISLLFSYRKLTDFFCIKYLIRDINLHSVCRYLERMSMRLRQDLRAIYHSRMLQMWL